MPCRVWLLLPVTVLVTLSVAPLPVSVKVLAVCGSCPMWLCRSRRGHFAASVRLSRLVAGTGDRVIAQGERAGAVAAGFLQRETQGFRRRHGDRAARLVQQLSRVEPITLPVSVRLNVPPVSVPLCEVVGA